MAWRPGGAPSTTPARRHHSVSFTIYAPAGAGRARLPGHEWPGHGWPTISPSVRGGEYLREEEYQEFFANRSEFFLRKMLPRLAGNLRGLAKLPPLDTAALGYVWPGVLPAFCDPEVTLALETLLAMSKEQAKWARTCAEFARELKDAGFPSIKEQTVLAPYDLVADNLRGTTGAAQDLLVNPAKLARAIEDLAPFMAKAGINGARAKHNPGSSSPAQGHRQLHVSAPLQAVLLALPPAAGPGADRGRLHALSADRGALQHPPGHHQGGAPRKCIYHFEGTDNFAAKKKRAARSASWQPAQLSAHHRQRGAGAEHTKRLIDVCGQGGGYIMSASALIDHASRPTWRPGSRPPASTAATPRPAADGPTLPRPGARRPRPGCPRRRRCPQRGRPARPRSPLAEPAHSR